MRVEARVEFSLRTAITTIATYLVLSASLFLISPIGLGAAEESPFGEPVVLTAGGHAAEGSPSVALDGTQTVYTAWSEETPLDGSANIWLAKSLDRGSVWTTGLLIQEDSPNPRLRLSPALAADSLGRLHGVWVELAPGLESIAAASSTDGGATWRGPFTLSTGDCRVGVQSAPTLALDPVDTLYVAWYSLPAGTVCVSSSPDGGFRWSSPSAAFPTLGGRLSVGVGAPGVVGGSEGRVYVAWTVWPGSGPFMQSLSIYFARSGDGALTWSDPMPINPENEAAGPSGPAIAVDRAGTIYLAWQDQAGDIRLAVSRNEGTTWTHLPDRVNDEPGATQPVLQVNGDILFAMWESSESGSQEVRFAKSLDQGGTWTSHISVSQGTIAGSHRYPSFVLGPKDEAYAAWLVSRPNDTKRDVLFSVGFVLPDETPPVTVELFVAVIGVASAAVFAGMVLYGRRKRAKSANSRERERET